ncbi:PIN domain nuclease [Micromonospora sp. NPDC047707]|uniref:PIN domain nuclease n=1 Tax=unclassified Micromonospora TaxID=2617518 RepID=UPI0012B4A23D|nr:PIN domain nuclease [Micromonospora sp. WMMC415]QGN45441.1 PIN domain-containing protein [Micromonospora sp. WMMC415]
MRLADYLVDTSALVRLLRNAELRARWESPLTAGLIAVCPVVELEFLYTARSAADREWLQHQLRTVFGWVMMPDRGYERAAEIQHDLTLRGVHRSAGAVDLLIAATAEYHGMSLLHYDRDFDQIANVTGQPATWVARAGSIK